jgi:hypothetical protein
MIMLHIEGFLVSANRTIFLSGLTGGWEACFAVSSMSRFLPKTEYRRWLTQIFNGCPTLRAG